MYPKNAASPEPIAIGAVVQISDGAVQTSGCTVRIKPIGVAEGDGAGTTAYSTDGIVEYTPTQGETNYTSFILIAKKTGCIPVSVTVVTTASSVPGVAIGFGRTHRIALPIPDGSIGQGDRQHAVGLYSGILAASTVVVIVTCAHASAVDLVTCISSAVDAVFCRSSGVEIVSCISGAPPC